MLIIYREHWKEFLLQPPPSSQVLDYICGQGRSSATLKRKRSSLSQQNGPCNAPHNWRAHAHLVFTSTLTSPWNEYSNTEPKWKRRYLLEHRHFYVNSCGSKICANQSTHNQLNLSWSNQKRVLNLCILV